MIRKTILFVLAMLLLAAPIAQARDYIDINSPFSRKLPLALPEFQAMEGNLPNADGIGATKVLQKYLGYTGLFEFMSQSSFLGKPQPGAVRYPMWKKIGAELLITGTYGMEAGLFVLECRLYDISEGKLLTGRRYDGNVSSIPTMMARFADDVMLALTGERSIFSTMIAFVGARQGEKGVVKEIMTMRFDGSGVTKFSKQGDLSLYPAWKQDGSLLTYSSYVNRHPAIFVQALAGGEGRIVTKKPGTNISPVFRPGTDQLAVAMSYTGKNNIFLLDLRGKVIKQLTDGWGIEVQPSFSPDGNRMAYVSDRGGSPHIYVMEMRGGMPKRLTYGLKYCSSPAWSPKGDRIAFQAQVNGVFQIGTVKPDGSDLRIITSGYGGAEDPAWSPDGRLIAYAGRKTGRYQIYIMTANGQPITRLTNLPGEQTDPAWSPRGILKR